MAYCSLDLHLHPSIWESGFLLLIGDDDSLSGQHVSGEIFVNLLSEIEFSKLTLEISGVEAIHYKSPPRR